MTRLAAGHRALDAMERHLDDRQFLVGDSLTVVMDRRYVSFMYSYPNLIPLPASAIHRILDTLRPYRFERVYGGWNGRVVAVEGSDAVERSAARYLQWIGHEAS